MSDTPNGTRKVEKAFLIFEYALQDSTDCPKAISTMDRDLGSTFG